ncbi:MAG: hypothetical protein IT191_07660 [Microbacteriaceae bacterium]|nr:hypothetical protein [Cryobacterium sp.]MBX3103960.1 hypothetical protein [Cryobacterium sp.]MCC6376879.1 hypothetical protein [Microbacteriaceae bacterium]
MTPQTDDDSELSALGREIERLATVVTRSSSNETELFERASALRDNAMGIIYDGDGSSEGERIGRLLALVPALLNVVDEARDTISRLRDLVAEQDPAKAVSEWDSVGRADPSRPTWSNKADSDY